MLLTSNDYLMNLSSKSWIDVIYHFKYLLRAGTMLRTLGYGLFDNDKFQIIAAAVHILLFPFTGKDLQLLKTVSLTRATESWNSVKLLP